MADEQLIGEVVEQVADQIEEVANVTRQLTGREIGFFIAGAGIGVAVGFAAGFFAMEKRVGKKYDKIVSDEIMAMREHYNQMAVALKGEAARRRPLEELIVERGYAEGPETSEAPAPQQESKFEKTSDEVMAEIKRNVFEEQGYIEDDDEWDYEVEVPNRNPEEPYVIHLDEFKENDPRHEQVTYTYYMQDDVVADFRDSQIDDFDKVVGLGNLDSFGHGSLDPEIVYIRNERLDLDIELVRDRGSFAEQTGRHLRHSSDRRRRPNRHFDDDD